MADKTLSLRQKLLAGVAIAAVATGGTVAALAATGDGKHAGRRVASAHAAGPHQGCLAGQQLLVASGYLGVSRAQVRSELGSGKTLARAAATTPGRSADGLLKAIISAKLARLRSGRAGGRITQAQSEARAANMTRRMTETINRPTSCRARTAARSVPDLRAAAHYLGISSDQLRSQLASGRSLAEVAAATSGRSAAGLIAALVAERKAKLGAAAAAGKITHAQENSRVADAVAAVTAAVNRVVELSPSQHRAHGRLSKAAAYLGTTPEQLMAALRSGRTLAQVADATQGKSAGGLVDALVHSARAKLDAGVAAGHLTAAQEKRLLATLSQRLTAAVNATRR
jgi:hypothetical protein